MELLKRLYTDTFGIEPHSIEPLAGAGSNRLYYRFYDGDGKSVIGVIGTSQDENHAFITIAKHFERRQLPVPHVIAHSKDEMRYFQEDLGSRSLFDAVKGGRDAGGRYNNAEKELLKQTIRELPNLQIRGARGMDFSVCYPQPEFDVANVLFDLNYFKYCFLKATDLDFHELKLEANFRMLAKDLVALGTTESFMYRDFQARNVMLDKNGKPYFIDFKVAGKGHIIMMWHHSYGKHRHVIPTLCAKNSLKSITTRCSNTQKCRAARSSTKGFSCLCCSAHCRFSAHTVSEDITNARSIS